VGHSVGELHLGDQKNRESAMCKVDAMIVKKGRIEVVVEIEESGFSPTKIFGKFRPRFFRILVYI
jgi:hypothetical protein